MDDIREAANAKGSHSIRIDADSLWISLNPREGFGALDDKIGTEPPGPLLVPPAPSIEIRDDLEAIPSRYSPSPNPVSRRSLSEAVNIDTGQFFLSAWH
ncbi:MAG: hypothetical protein NTY25_00440 [Planctomycetia bacterium]|nr:hypothetical protein [Planctomycetia bacterium]